MQAQHSAGGGAHEGTGTGGSPESDNAVLLTTPRVEKGAVFARLVELPPSAVVRIKGSFTSAAATHDARRNRRLASARAVPLPLVSSEAGRQVPRNASVALRFRGHTRNCGNGVFPSPWREGAGEQGDTRLGEPTRINQQTEGAPLQAGQRPGPAPGVAQRLGRGRRDLERELDCQGVVALKIVPRELVLLSLL